MTAARADLADKRLEGLVDADRFVDGKSARISVPVLDICRFASPESPVETQALMGDSVRVFEETPEGWAWIQLDCDQYVGYVSSDALSYSSADPTHRVTAFTTFLYEGPDLKTTKRNILPCDAKIALGRSQETRHTLYWQCQDSGLWIVDQHIEPITAPKRDDFVAEAERYLNVPYLWAGTSAFGVDCSGIIQRALFSTGGFSFRDTDMQEKTLGEEIATGGELPDDLQRGDILFWPGHTGIMTNETELLHANGHTMTVAKEPVYEAIERIAYLYDRPTSVRRISL